MSASARQMLEQLRAEQNPARQLLEKLRMEDQIETSPTPVPKPIGNLTAPGMPVIPGKWVDPISPEQRAAAAAGVDVTSGMPDAPRGEASFSPNEAYKQSFLADYAKKRFGKDTPVRVGPESKDVEYLNPRTKRWTTFDEAGFSTADLKDLWGPTTVGLPAAAGGVVGSVLGPEGTVAGTAAGGGVGAFLGETGRLLYGRKKGVHNLPLKDILREASKASGIEVATTVTGEKLVHLGQLAKRFFRPNALDPVEAARILKEAEEALGIVSEVNKAGGKFNPSIPQLLQDQELNAELMATTTGSRSRRLDLQDRDQANQEALDKYYTQQFGVEGADPAKIGAQVKGQFDLNTQNAANRTSAGLEQQTQLSREQINQLPVYDESASGRVARQAVEAERARRSQAANEAWDNYRNTIGFNPNTFTSNHSLRIEGEPARIINSMDAERQAAIFGFERNHLGQVLPDELVTAVQNGRPIDLATIDRSIQKLRQRSRQANTSLGLDVNTADLARVESALVMARREYLNRVAPDALTALDAAEAASRRKSDLVRRSALSDVLRRDGDGYRLTDSDVFRSIFIKRDAEAARELYAIADPQQRLALQRGVMSIYRENFTENGVPRPTLHSKFMRDYAEVAGAFFSPENQASVRRFGEMGAALERESERAASYLRTLNRGLNKKVESTRPEDLVKGILDGKFSGQDVRTISSAMTKAGYKDQAIKAFGAEIQGRIFREGQFSASALSDLLYKKGAQIIQFGGDAYFRDLKKFERMAKIGSRVAARSAGKENESVLMRASRVIVRPLSREGLARTALRDINSKNREAVLYEILTDPAKLREFVNLQTSRASDRRAAALLSSVGGGWILSERAGE